VIGEAGLTTALHEIGYLLTEHDPEYVVLGETTAYSFERITHAVRLVEAGARFIATNRDVNGPTDTGTAPATGAVAALISSATGVRPYFVGKPNPLMMRTALNTIDAHSEESVMVGDRMDTDIAAGTESGMETILVLSGVTRREDVNRFPYRPTQIFESVAEIMP
jgi:NagD protein